MKLKAIFLAGAALLAAATAAKADTWVMNANGYALGKDGKAVPFRTMRIGKDGKIAWITQAVPRIAWGPDDVMVDAGGKTVIPGLIDAHGHVMGLGFQALALDLTGTKSLDEALQRLKAYAAANPDKPWIIGRGWNQEIWKLGRFPTAAELDAVVGDRPVWLGRVDGHAGWANTRALQIAGVTAASRDPVGGRIERKADGSPAGVLVDAAQDVVDAKVPAPTAADAEAALTAALKIMAEVGLTGVGDAGADPRTWALYDRFGKEGRLTARIYAMAGGMESLEAISPKGPVDWTHDDRLALKSVKLYSDGALGSRGAFLKAPYSDDPKNIGLQFLPQDKLNGMVRSAASRGYQVNVHAIGDGANAEVLDAFESVKAVTPKGLRHRVEHAQVVDPVDLPRFAKLEVIASMQPTHATSDKNMAEDRLGKARMKGAYAWRSVLDSGAKFAGGSDFPVEAPNPFFGIHAAVTRQDHNDQPLGGWYPGEALTLDEALAAFTTGAAYAEFGEGKFGNLETGKWADFLILDADPYEIPPKDLWKIKVQETWVGGKRVYQREGAAK